MAVTASNGGLMPWQAGWATGFGRFQFVLGRELGATFYGYGLDVTTVMAAATPGEDARVVEIKSINFDLPILEYRPYRAFDTKQSSAALVQLFVGAECRNAHRHLAAGSTGGQAQHGVFDRPAPDLRLASLLLGQRAPMRAPG